MPKRRYAIDTPDKALIDDAIHVVGGGSLRELARKIGKSEGSLRHVLSGLTESLDDSTFTMLQHLITVEQTRDLLGEVNQRWLQGNRAYVVARHLMTCRACLASAIISSERHFTDSVARVRRN